MWTSLVVLSLLACTGDPADSGVAAAFVELGTGRAIGTVVVAVAEAEGAGAVEVRAEGGPTAQAARGEDGLWRTTLVGLKPDTTYALDLVVDGAVADSAELTTGPAPGALPALSATGDGSAEQWDGLLVTSIMSEPSFAVVVDADGDYAWWHQSPYDGHVITRALPLPDGSGIYYLSKSNAADGDESQPTWLVEVSWDGADLRTTQLDKAHHDLWMLDDGTLLYLGSDPRVVDGEAFRGDRLVERAPDGTERTVWSAFDSFEPDPDLETTAGTGWTHANSIDYDADTDTVLLGMRNFDAIVKLDRATGAVRWQLGGVLSDFAVGEADRFRSQHQFHALGDDRLLVFDNGTTDRLASRAIELQLDLSAWTATATWQHETDPPIYCYGPGDVHRLDSGDTLVTWGSSGLVDQVGPDGALRWSLVGSVGGALGYVSPVAALGGPPAADR